MAKGLVLDYETFNTHVYYLWIVARYRFFFCFIIFYVIRPVSFGISGLHTHMHALRYIIVDISASRLPPLARLLRYRVGCSAAPTISSTLRACMNITSLSNVVSGSEKQIMLQNNNPIQAQNVAFCCCRNIIHRFFQARWMLYTPKTGTDVFFRENRTRVAYVYRDSTVHVECQ